MDKIHVPRFKKEMGFETTAERSLLMSKIRSVKTKPEMLMRKALWAAGIRFRINYKKLPGNPDIVIKKNNIVIFIDGEFWHGYNWLQKKERIKSNRDFWIPKIERNMQRDLQNNEMLQAMGYTVLRFWEQEIKKDIQKCVTEVLAIIKQHSSP